MLLALAPLWNFLPSRRQRLQARLRECAALNGLFVEFRDLPLPSARLARLPAADRQVLYYGRRLRPQRGEPRVRTAWFRDGDDWGSLPPRTMVPAVAAELPPQVLAIEVSAASCGIFWREEGDENLVRSLAATLAAWGDELTPP